MKKSRFTDSQIVAILKQAENGVPVPELCRQRHEQRQFLQIEHQIRWHGCFAHSANERAGAGKQPPEKDVLRNVKGYVWNHKRVYRIYRELELHLRIKPKKRIKRDVPESLTVPESSNKVWSMDFMHDQLQNRRCVRLFNVIDDFNSEGLGHRDRFSLPSERVIRALEQIIEWRGCQPGKPQQNGYVERYNRTVSYDWLNQHLFETVDEMQDFATKWLWTYNNERPNMAIGGITPAMKLKQAA